MENPKVMKLVNNQFRQLAIQAIRKAIRKFCSSIEREREDRERLTDLEKFYLLSFVVTVNLLLLFLFLLFWFFFLDIEGRISDEKRPSLPVNLKKKKRLFYAL